MSTNLSAVKPEGKPSQSPTPGRSPDKVQAKPHPGTAKPDSSPKPGAGKAEPKKTQR